MVYQGKLGDWPTATILEIHAMGVGIPGGYSEVITHNS